MTMLILDSG